MWADPHSFDLLRLEIHADEIPSYLPLVDVITFIDYAPMHVGGADLLMPQTADVHLVRSSGEEDRNIIEFTHCRSFKTEANISFPADPSKSASPLAGRPTAPQVEQPVPGGLLVPLSLSVPITQQAAIGQPIEAKVTGNVLYKNQIIIPEGSLVRGRVRRLERYSQPENYFIVALEFNEIQAGDSLLRFYADLQQIETAAGVELVLSHPTNTSRQSSGFRGISPASGHEYDFSQVQITDEQIHLYALPGVGSFFVRGTQFTLPKGLAMTWKTQPLQR